MPTSKDGQIEALKRRVKELEQMNQMLRDKIHKLDSLNNEMWLNYMHQSALINMYQADLKTKENN